MLQSPEDDFACLASGKGTGAPNGQTTACCGSSSKCPGAPLAVLAATAGYFIILFKRGTVHHHTPPSNNIPVLVASGTFPASCFLDFDFWGF